MATKWVSDRAAEFWLRTITSLLFGVIFLAVLYLGGVPWLLWLMLAAAIVYLEFSHVVQAAGYRPSAVVGLAIVLALMIQAFFDLHLPWLFVSLGLLTTVTWATRPEVSLAGFISDWATTLAGILYSGGLLLHGVLLRNLDQGMAWAALALLGTWSCDTFAYLVGKRWGRHPFAPRISPKKTWEGAVGGFLGSLITVLLAAYAFGIPWIHGLALGGLVPLAAISGDLTESMLKRSAGVKDAGRLIPGHGGLLDRIDGLLFVIPTVYYYVVLFAGS